MGNKKKIKVEVLAWMVLLSVIWTGIWLGCFWMNGEEISPPKGISAWVLVFGWGWILWLPIGLVVVSLLTLTGELMDDIFFLFALWPFGVWALLPILIFRGLALWEKYFPPVSIRPSGQAG